VLVTGMGWHVGLLGLFALVVLVVVVLVVALVASASRRPTPPEPGPWTGHPQQGAPTVGFGGAAGSPVAPGTSAAGRSVEQRLAELEDLRRRGVVDADEYAAARIRILGEL